MITIAAKSQVFKIERQTEISLTGRCVTRFERAIPLSHSSARILHHRSAIAEPNSQHELLASPLFGVFRRFKFNSGTILALWPPVLTRRNPGEPSGGAHPLDFIVSLNTTLIRGQSGEILNAQFSGVVQ